MGHLLKDFLFQDVKLPNDKENDTKSTTQGGYKILQNVNFTDLQAGKLNIWTILHELVRHSFVLFELKHRLVLLNLKHKNKTRT